MEPSEPAKRFKHLEISEKAKIVAWSQEGLSSRKIAARLGCAKATINRVTNNAKQLEEGAIPVRKEGSGRPRCPETCCLS
jgi:transposase